LERKTFFVVYAEQDTEARTNKRSTFDQTQVTATINHL